MKYYTLIFTILLSGGLYRSYAQINPVRIHESAQRYGPCEPSVAINPKNPKHIVAASVLHNIYRSADGGKSWEKQTVQSPFGVWGDPCLIADRDGNFYYFHLSNPAGKGWESDELLDRIVCQKSADQGASWSDGSSIGFRDARHDQDKEWACADARTGHLYVTWTEFDKYKSQQPEDSSYILFSKSIDGANLWSEPVRINQKAGNCLDDDKTVEGAVPTVGPEGQLYVAWAFNDTIYFDRSADEGNTWMSQDRIVAAQPGGWNYSVPGLSRSNGLPVTVCDTSQSAHRGTIYVNWTDLRQGSDDADVWIAKSTDEGDTWSAPVRVNNDAAGHQQFLTWMAVDPFSGYLYVVFYDRRHHGGNQTDVYLAYSTDGGDTFANVKVTQKPFFLAEEGPFFGDYNQIAAYNGVIHPIWTQMDGKKLSVWTAAIEHRMLKKLAKPRRQSE